MLSVCGIPTRTGAKYERNVSVLPDIFQLRMHITKRQTDYAGRGVSTLRRSVSGEKQNCAGNLKILPARNREKHKVKKLKF